MSASYIVNDIKQYADEVVTAIKKTDWDALAGIINAFLSVKERGGRIFVAGNGGSRTFDT